MIMTRDTPATYLRKKTGQTGICQVISRILSHRKVNFLFILCVVTSEKSAERKKPMGERDEGLSSAMVDRREEQQQQQDQDF